MRASLFGNLRSGATSTAGSPIQTPSTHTKTDSTGLNDVEPLYLPPSAATNSTTTTGTNPPIPAPRSRPLTRLTPFGRKSSPSREVSLPPQPLHASSTTPTASPALPPSSPSLGATGGVSYLDSLGLRLGEAVNKALILPAASAIVGTSKSAVGVGSVAGSGAKVVPGASEGPDAVLKGKRPLPAGRGRSLGALITSELHHASNVLQDSFLHRAILRLLQRPLTVVITNLTQQVTQLLLAPEFNPSIPLILNATQVHALAYAHFASELLETFDALALGRKSGTVNDGLRPLREGLENVVTKVVGPLLGAIKSEVSGVITELEKESVPVTTITAATAPDQKFDKTLVRVAPLLARVTFAGEPAQSSHVQSMLATFEIGVVWGSLVALSNRPLPRCSPDDLSPPKREPSPDLSLRRTMSEGRLRSQPSDSSLSTSSSDDSAKTDYAAQEKRPQQQQQQQLPSYITPPDTPHMAPVGTKSEKSSSLSGTKPNVKEQKSTLSLAAAVNGLTQRSSPITSPATSQTSSPTGRTSPPSSKKLSIVKLPSLKPLTVARAPSPPTVKVAAATPSSPLRLQVASDPFAMVYKPFVLALHALARDAKLVQLSVKRLVLPVEGGLAREAVDEALKELNGFVGFTDYLAAPDTGSSALLLGGGGGASGGGVDLAKVMEKTREAPLLLVLPVMLRVAMLSAKSDAPVGVATPPKVPDTVSAWIGLPEDEYRRSCLSGFAKADECAAIVGKAVLKNKRTAVMGWMRDWLERSVQEEEEESSSDEEEDEGAVIRA